MSNPPNPSAAIPDPLLSAATPTSDSTPQQSSVATATSSDRTKTWNTEELLGSEAEAFIVHRGQTYRLRCTKQGKLILYK